MAQEMAQFYSDSLDRQRANFLLRRIKDDLLESADQGFFFKGVLGAVFADDALELLLRASGGDLYRLFAIAVNSGRLARYRYEDYPSSERRVLRTDVESAVREQLGIFRNELGTAPNDPGDVPWDAKLQKLRDIYEGQPAANVPDKALYQLLRRRAVLFFNGRGRYGVHPMAVEILREQLVSDRQFKYRGGGLDLTP